MRDAVFAPKPRYPYHNSGESLSRDPGTWTRDSQGNGLYRLDIELNTGHVSRVTIIKSAGSKVLDSASTDTFKRWVFKPGKWREITLPVTVRTKWVSVINKAG